MKKTARAKLIGTLVVVFAALAVCAVRADSGAPGRQAPCFPIALKDVAKSESAVAAEDGKAFIPRMGHRPSSVVPSAAPRDLPVDVGPGVIPPPTIGASFVGLAQGSAIPPDPDMTVGPNHVAQVVNLRLRVTTKTGTEQFLSTLTGAAGNFWSGMGVVGFTSDPKVMYDEYADRYVVEMIEVFNDFSGGAVLLAVSATSNPTGVWNRYRTVSTTNIAGTNYWADYTSLGIDQQSVYFCANLYNAAGTVFGGVKYRAFNKTPLLSGSPATFNDLLDTSVPADFSGPRASHHFGSPQGGFFAGVVTPNKLHITCIQNPNASPTLAAVDVTIPSWSPPAVLAPNLGGSGIDPLDGRTQNAVWRNGRMVTAHSIDDGTGTRNLASWYEIDTGNWPASGSPTLIQSGNIDAGPGIHTYQPAITVNTCDQLGVVFTRSSASEHVGIYVTGREATDTPGTMRPMTAVQVSAVGYSPTDNRFGDYLGADVDPTDGQTFWCDGEIATASNTWGTWVASFTVAPCCIPPVVNTIANTASVCSVSFTSPAPSVSAGTAPITWSLVGATPPGMTINPGTGIVSWPSPIASATPYSLTTRATNACGNNSQNWTLTVKPGDFTGDGQVTPADIPMFIDALLGNPVATPCAADVNLDGLINGRDIQAFENSL